MMGLSAGELRFAKEVAKLVTKKLRKKKRITLLGRLETLRKVWGNGARCVGAGRACEEIAVWRGYWGDEAVRGA
jgi:hypothetical protein